MVKPTVISLFAGCGGSSLGYKMAGFDERLAVEWDDNAVETFKINFPGVPVYHGDISKLSVEECMKLSGVEEGALDILDGSPPCQGFSTTGKRKIKDQRNLLFHEYARLLEGLKPKAFVFENVTGLIKGYMKQIYLEITGKLRDCGYSVRGEVLNAKYFNVPQNRERVVIIGVRSDMGVSPTFPKPQTKPISVRKAFRNVPEDGENRVLPEWLKQYAKVHPGGWNTEPERYKKIKGSYAGAMSMKWCEWDKICGTLCKSEISTTGVVHPDKERYLSLSEAKRISAFPDDFIFTGRKAGIERIGNSVPPNLMKAVALHIKENILMPEAPDGND